MITVYSKPACAQCVGLKKALDKKGIHYREIDIFDDEDGYNHVVYELGYKTLPVVVTDDDHWSGYRMDKISALERNTSLEGKSI